ncbi:uncharacterized protein LOC117317624 [Pecten maximus]|uniref:uncharacterized protein LOC117317624 n=1 Tax=Pecten maximus TaxID=6579 RepID=UPI0014581DEF|nr:uncharacterized protein LOC117317624 [Pecten maximus]
MPPKMECNTDLLLLAMLSWLCKPLSCELALGQPGENCKLWVPPDFKTVTPNDKVDVGSPSVLSSVSLVQIGVYVEHTKWINFEGCTAHLHDGQCVHRLSGRTDPIVECYHYCNKSIFSLFNGCCYCKEYDHRRPTLCQTKNCFPKYNGFCGEYFRDRNSGCFCQYRPIEQTVSGGPYNCLALRHTTGQNVRVQPESCDKDLKYIGKRGKQNHVFTKSDWWTAALGVQRDLYFFANETYLKRSIAFNQNTLYWTGVFRKHMLVTERPNTVEFCGVLVKDGGGSVRFNIKRCNNSYPRLCVINGGSSLIPPTTTLTPTTLTPSILTPSTQTIPVDSCTPGHVCNTTDVRPTEDDVICISTAGFIAIIIVIILLLVISVAGFVINYRKSKTSELVRDRNVSTEMRQLRNEPQHDGNDYNQLNIDEISNNVYQEMGINAGLRDEQQDDGNDYNQLNIDEMGNTAYHEIGTNADVN